MLTRHTMTVREKSVGWTLRETQKRTQKRTQKQVSHVAILPCRESHSALVPTFSTLSSNSTCSSQALERKLRSTYSYKLARSGDTLLLPNGNNNRVFSTSHGASRAARDHMNPCSTTSGLRASLRDSFRPSWVESILISGQNQNQSQRQRQRQRHGYASKLALSFPYIIGCLGSGATMVLGFLLMALQNDHHQQGGETHLSADQKENSLGIPSLHEGITLALGRSHCAHSTASDRLLLQSRTWTTLPNSTSTSSAHSNSAEVKAAHAADAIDPQSPSVKALSNQLNSKTMSKGAIPTLGLKDVIFDENGVVLGVGSYGIVKLARLKESNEEIALKVVNRADTVRTRAVQQEISALRRVEEAGGHPNIVKLKALVDLETVDESELIGNLALSSSNTNRQGQKKSTPTRDKRKREQEEKIGLAFETLMGGELYDRLVRDGPFSEATASKLIAQVVEALAFLHEDARIIHGDIKPENLLLTHDDTVKLCDFGSAVLLPEDSAVNSFKLDPRNAIGTCAYSAPEVIEPFALRGIEARKQEEESKSKTWRNASFWKAKKKKEPSMVDKPGGETAIANSTTMKSNMVTEGSAALDIFSLGIVLYVLLSGMHPFDPDNNLLSDVDISVSIYENDHDFSDPVWKHISASAKDLISRMLQKDPKKRITCKEVLNHPWVAGKRSTKVIEGSDVRLKEFVETQRALREHILALIVDGSLRLPNGWGPESESEAEPDSKQCTGQSAHLSLLEAPLESSADEPSSDQHKSGVSKSSNSNSNSNSKSKSGSKSRSRQKDKRNDPNRGALDRVYESIDKEGKGFIVPKDIERAKHRDNGGGKDNPGTVASEKQNGGERNKAEGKEREKEEKGKEGEGDSAVHYRSMDGILGLGKKVSFQKGDVVFHSGDESDHFYFINKGRVEVLAKIKGSTEPGSKKGKSGSSRNVVDEEKNLRHITYLEQGDFFGETGLMRKSPRNATVKCVTEVELVKLSTQEFQALVESAHPSSSSSTGDHKLSPAAAKLRSVAAKRSREHISNIFGSLENVETVDLEPGQQLFRKGDPSDDTMYFIVEGTVAVYDSQGNVRVKRKAGDTVGELGMLSGSPRSATVCCSQGSSEHCVLKAVKEEDLKKIMDNFEVARALKRARSDYTAVDTVQRLSRSDTRVVVIGPESQKN